MKSHWSWLLLADFHNGNIKHFIIPTSLIYSLYMAHECIWWYYTPLHKSTTKSGFAWPLPRFMSILCHTSTYSYGPFWPTCNWSLADSASSSLAKDHTSDMRDVSSVIPNPKQQKGLATHRVSLQGRGWFSKIRIQKCLLHFVDVAFPISSQMQRCVHFCALGAPNTVSCSHRMIGTSMTVSAPQMKHWHQVWGTNMLVKLCDMIMMNI